MNCIVHLSDLHRGAHATPDVDDALVTLCHELAPALVIASGDLSNRGRVAELELASTLLERLPAPTLVVPGNHDIPYAFPARFTQPWRAFETVYGATRSIHTGEGFVAVGLNSVRPWRHQGGRLSEESLAFAATALQAAPTDALRIVVLHHHLAGAPWRASRKFPLKHRDQALAALADAGADLVVGGHIHQASVAERHEFTVVDGGARPLVVATAPGFGRPRPRRSGEAQGLNVIRWDDVEVSVETRIWDRVGFVATGRRQFPRYASPL